MSTESEGLELTALAWNLCEQESEQKTQHSFVL